MPVIPLLVLSITAFLVFKYQSLQKAVKLSGVISSAEPVLFSPDGKQQVQAKSGKVKIINWDPDTGNLKVQNSDGENPGPMPVEAFLKLAKQEITDKI